MRPSPRNLALLLAMLMGAGCASADKKPVQTGLSQDPAAFDRILEMPPLLVESTPDGYQSWDAEQLFLAGNDAYDAGEWEDATSHYDRIVRNFEDDPLVPSALFNAGLALEHQDRPELAERYFAGLVGRYPEHHLAPNALWNLLELREQREDWEAVRETVEALNSYDLEPVDAFEIEARGWIARTLLEPTDANLERLESLSVQYGQRLRQGQALSRPAYARLFWTIGEVYLGRSQAVAIDANSKALEDQMEEKAGLLLKAQDAYMRTIRALDPYWATAAVFRIGFAYESFYADLVQAPAPDELADQERKLYFDEVREALTPVKRKAEIAYKRIIRFSKQYSLNTDWVERAEQRLERLQSLKLPGEEPTSGGS